MYGLVRGKFFLRHRSISALSGSIRSLSCDTMSAALLKRCSDGTEDGGIDRYLHAKSTKQGHNDFFPSQYVKGWIHSTCANTGSFKYISVVSEHVYYDYI